MSVIEVLETILFAVVVAVLLLTVFSVIRNVLYCELYARIEERILTPWLETIKYETEQRYNKTEMSEEEEEKWLEKMGELGCISRSYNALFDTAFPTKQGEIPWRMLNKYVRRRTEILRKRAEKAGVVMKKNATMPLSQKR